LWIVHVVPTWASFFTGGAGATHVLAEFLIGRELLGSADVSLVLFFLLLLLLQDHDGHNRFTIEIRQYQVSSFP
jgi:hypothetical protein